MTDSEDTLVRDVGTVVEFAQTRLDSDSKQNSNSNSNSLRSPTRTSSTSIPGSTGRAYVVRGDSSPSFEPPLSPRAKQKANISGQSHHMHDMHHNNNINDLVSDHHFHRDSISNSFTRHTMVTVCSSLYCIILIAVGIGFALAYMVMQTSSSFNINIYHSFHVYLYSFGILIQLICLCRKLCDTCDAFYSNGGAASRSHYDPFGSLPFRLISGVFGILSVIWFLIEFSWRVDVIRITGHLCSHTSIHIAVLALAVLYTLLHVFITFYNCKLLVIDYELLVLFGIMHMVGTNISTWAWTAAHFSIATIHFNNETQLELDICETVSPLGDLVSVSHAYFSPFVSVFALWTSALFISLFLHHLRHSTFLNPQHLERIVKKSSHRWACDANLLGVLSSVLLICGVVVLVVYHYLLIQWQQEDLAQLIVEIVCVGLEAVGILLCLVLLFVHHANNDGLSRETTLETLIILISVFGLFLWNIGKALGAFRLDVTSLYQWTAAASIVEIAEVLLQSTLLLSALKYVGKVLGAPAYRFQQSATMYLVLYNMCMATFMFMRQHESLYGRVYTNSFGLWMWLVWRFFLPCFPIIYRLFSAVCFMSLWGRTYHKTTSS